MSQVMSSVFSEMTGVSGVKSVGEDKSMMFKAYRGPLPNHPRWYELPSISCRNDDLGVTPNRGEEHDTRDMICIYKNTMREDAMEFGYLCVRAPTQQELKIAERVAAYNTDDMDRIARIDERDEQCRK